jgi:hypothetical protein
LNLILFRILIAAQIYRYRRMSTQFQHQHTKWLLFSFSAP